MLTVAAIVRDERPYLIEWVAHYRLIGFERILVYSNECGDGTDVLLDRMQAAGLVTHHRWPDQPGVVAQHAAYGHAAAVAEPGWILFADADEFLCLHQDRHVGAFLDRFDADVSAIAINWRLFGSAGQLWRGPQPVTQRFTRAAPRGAHNERHFKTIARVADIGHPAVHRVFLTRGRYVDADGREIAIERNGFTPAVAHGRAQLNHYVVKSRAEFDDKRRRGNAALPPEAPNRLTWRDGNFFTQHDTNDEEDRAIQRDLPALKAEMARIAALVGGPA
jgi:hypothetical protein